MAHKVCPWWLGYWLIFPGRRLFQDPAAIVAPWVKEGMTVLEIGPGMGFFTLELARRAGATGRVVAVDIERKMLSVLKTRLEKAGLAARVEARLVPPESLRLGDLNAKVDFCLVFAVAHELQDADVFFREVFASLRPGGKMLLAEPKLHVKLEEFEETLEAAWRAGFASEDAPNIRLSRTAVLVK